MTVATIATQHIGLGFPLPTYSTITNPEYIDLEPATFIHLYNGSDIDEAIVLVATQPDYAGIYHCQVVVISATSELILGPFDMATFGPQIELIYICSHALGNLTLAALTPYNIYEVPCDTTVTTVYPSVETAGTVIAACPQAIDATCIWPPGITAGTVASACPQAVDATATWQVGSSSTYAWGAHTDGTIAWCAI